MRFLVATLALVSIGVAISLFGVQSGSVWVILLGTVVILSGCFTARPLAKHTIEWLDRQGL